MIGTAPEGKGGVAAVVAVYIAQGLFERFPIRYVATHREGGRLTKLTCAMRAFAQVLWMLMRGQVALVHAHSASNASFKRKSFYLVLARAFGVPTVFHLHGGGFRTFTDQTASPRLRAWIVKTLSSSSCVIALSSAWAEYVHGLAPSVKVQIVPNPVFIPVQPTSANVEPGRLLFMGRASQAKGIFDLLDAMAILKPQWPNLKLALGGDGDLDAVRAYAAKRGLSEQLLVLGWVGENEKRTQYAQAEVFVLPSYNEGLPMAMLEAMAMAKPVVVTPVGGIPEAVQHEQQGLLVPVGQVDELAFAIARLLSNAELRLSLGAAARARVQERFSTDVVLGGLAALYREMGVEEKVVR